MSAEFKVETIQASEFSITFPYGFYVTRKPGVTRHYTFVLMNWCEDNFGEHGKRWNWMYLPISNCWRVEFQSQVDASAFKIRWA